MKKKKKKPIILDDLYYNDRFEEIVKRRREKEVGRLRFIQRPFCYEDHYNRFLQYHIHDNKLTIERNSNKEDIMKYLKNHKFLGKGISGVCFQVYYKKNTILIDNPIVLKIAVDIPCELIINECISLPYHKNIINHMSVSYKWNISEYFDILNKIPMDKKNKETVREFLMKKKVSDSEKEIVAISLMEHFPYDLNQFILARKDKNIEQFSNLQICRILRGIIEGLRELNVERHIFHRDLHPGNVFIYPEYGRVAIGDFGSMLYLHGTNELPITSEQFKMSRNGTMIPSEYSFNGFSGPPKFTDPYLLNFDETKEDTVKFEKTDLFSAGMNGLYLIRSSDKKNREEFTREDFDSSMNFARECVLSKKLDKRIVDLIEALTKKFGRINHTEALEWVIGLEREFELRELKK